MKRLSWIFFSLIAFSTFVRLFFSVDLTDESNYATHVWTFLHQWRLFQSDLFIHGTPAVVLSPLAFVYTSIFGNEALVLFLRLCFFGLMMTTAHFSYHFLKKYYAQEWALLSSALYVAFIPFSIPSWSYNNVAALGVPLSLFLLFSESKRQNMASGFIAALVSFCYPSMLIVYITAFCLTRRKAFLLPFLITISICTLFVLSSGEDSLHKVLAFAKIFGWSGGLDKSTSILSLFFNGFIHSGLWLLFILAFLPRYHLLLLCVFFLWLGFVSSQNLLPAIQWLIYAPFAPLFFYVIKHKQSAQPWFQPMLILGFLSAAVFGYTSSNIMINCVLGMMLPLQLLLLEIFRRWEQSNTIRKTYGSLIFCSIALYLSCNNFLSVYRDNPIHDLHTQIHSGPYRFLFTTPKRAELLEGFQKDIKVASKERRSIFSSYFASAYLFTNLEPVTGMFFIHDIQWPTPVQDLILHRTIKNGEWPDLVVTKISSQLNLSYQFEKFFLQSGKYKILIEKPEYRIFAKTEKSLH